MPIIKNVLYEDIVKLVRKTVINILGINANRVINSSSVRGADLQKAIDASKFDSFSLNDVFIVFDVTENDSDKYYVVPEENDGSTSSISSFDFNLKMYGNGCHNYSQKLLCGFKDQEILVDLREKGIYVKGVTHPRVHNEFINNTLWTRSDITINVRVRFNFATKDDSYAGGVDFDTTKMSSIDIKIF